MVHKDSELEVPPAAVISEIPRSLIGVQNLARVPITPSQSIQDVSTYSFQIQPCIPMELLGRESFLRMKIKLKKIGSNFTNTDQVSDNGMSWRETEIESDRQTGNKARYTATKVACR